MKDGMEEKSVASVALSPCSEWGVQDVPTNNNLHAVPNKQRTAAHQPSSRVRTERCTNPSTTTRQVNYVHSSALSAAIVLPTSLKRFLSAKPAKNVPQPGLFLLPTHLPPPNSFLLCIHRSSCIAVKVII